MPTEAEHGKFLGKRVTVQSEVAIRQKTKAGTQPSLRMERTAIGFRKLQLSVQKRQCPQGSQDFCILLF